MYFSSVKTTRDQHTGWWRDDLRRQCGIARISCGTGVVPNSLVVVAHLSEGIPRFWLIDQVSLETFISNELEFGLRLPSRPRCSRMSRAPAGSRPSIRHLRAGHTAQVADQVGGVGLHAGSLVLHPTDWEGVELALSSTNAVEYLALPYDPATRRLFGLPVVTTVSQAAGVGHVLATDAVVAGHRHRASGCSGRSPPTPTTSART